MAECLLMTNDLLGKEPHEHVDVDRPMPQGTLGDVIVITLDKDARDVDSDSAIGTIFTIFLTHTPPRHWLP